MASGYYDITTKTLGRGHYGVVKLGRHCLTGEPVAMKIIEKSRLNDDSLNQLGTEIRILFRLSEYEHPNILKLYQTIDTEDKLFLVTEYCGPNACDLHDYLSRKNTRDGLSEKEAQIFFIQICSAISYCHSMSIVHRDLKPENILVTDYRHMYTNSKEGRNMMLDLQYPLLKLIDFGFANQWYPDEKMRTSCGTLAYSAPELLLGEPYDGTKVDVWGLGLMLYILLYGGNPFMQLNDNETLTKILDCSFATPTRSNVDYDAVELLRSLIKRNPETRLPIDSILRHKWLSGLPKPLELTLKYQSTKSGTSKLDHSPGSKQLPNCNKITPVVSPALPSISECGPLKNLTRSTDDDNELIGNMVPSNNTDQCESRSSSDSSSNGNNNNNTTQNITNYNRTRSLSITRIHTKPVQQQSLPQTRSSINLERLNQQSAINISPLPGLARCSQPLYRPTSPDVGGSAVLSDEERKLHELVIQDMFRLTKLIDSKSSIEASLKNARFAHRLFNQSSIQPATHFNKRKVSTGGLARSLMFSKDNSNRKQQQSGDSINSAQLSMGGQSKSNQTQAPAAAPAPAPAAAADKLGVINSKLNNDDYIYATYQLTRDKILRTRQEKLSVRTKDDPNSASGNNTNRSKPTTTSSQEAIPEEEVLGANVEGGTTSESGHDRTSAKENDGASSSRMQTQRKLLQPQHRMKDKFTSFFRSGSTSPSGSFNTSCESTSSQQHQPTQQQSCVNEASQLPPNTTTPASPNTTMAQSPNSSISAISEQHHHEAFSDHNQETTNISSSTGRYFGSASDSYENSMAYALPLARKCSLVSEESGCSNDLSDS